MDITIISQNAFFYKRGKRKEILQCTHFFLVNKAGISIERPLTTLLKSHPHTPTDSSKNTFHEAAKADFTLLPKLLLLPRPLR